MSTFVLLTMCCGQCCAHDLVLCTHLLPVVFVAVRDATVAQETLGSINASVSTAAVPEGEDDDDEEEDIEEVR